MLAALRAHGDLVPDEVLAPVCGPIWSYRTKTRLGVKLVLRKERVLIGFRERFAPFITDMDSCEILDQRIAVLIEPLAELIAGLSIARRLPQIEAAAGDQHVVLVMRTLDPPNSADLEQLRRFAKIHQVGIRLQPKGPDSIYELAAGEGNDDLEYQHPDHRVTLRFAPQHFTQINPVVNRKMVSLALGLLGVDRNDRVLDLFCGIGNFSLPLARYAGEVVGVEGDAALVEMARDNARKNGIGNASFRQADLRQCSLSEPWATGDCAAAIVDPPRSGAAAMMDALPRLGVARLVYVSCHADTLAQDASVLVKRHGYRLTRAGVLDMFPHTTHFESICLFERT